MTLNATRPGEAIVTEVVNANDGIKQSYDELFDAEEEAVNVGPREHSNPSSRVLLKKAKDLADSIAVDPEEPVPPPIVLIKEGTDKEVPFVKEKKDPEPPTGYGEIKVGMEGILNGVPVVVRKITKKDIVMRPLNRSIRDEHGMMVSFKEGK